MGHQDIYLLLVKQECFLAIPARREAFNAMNKLNQAEEKPTEASKQEAQKRMIVLENLDTFAFAVLSSINTYKPKNQSKAFQEKISHLEALINKAYSNCILSPTPFEMQIILKILVSETKFIAEYLKNLARE